jgi:DnaJ-class molecular chaperone
MKDQKKPCKACAGKGFDKSNCSDCWGSGYAHSVEALNQSPDGLHCGTCKGTGFEKSKCIICGGDGTAPTYSQNM